MMPRARDQLRQRVARLEDANAAKGVALRFFGKHTAHHGHECECAQVLIDALSDTAGEGWLPPEVGEQAKRALKDFLDAVPPNPDFIAEDGVKVYGLSMDELDINHARAALDALGVK